MVTQVAVRAPARVRHRGRGTTLILLSAVCFGTSGTIAKPAMLAGLSPGQVAAARIGLAAVVLAVGVAAFRPRLLRVRRADWPVLLGYGLLGVAGVQLGYFVAVQRLPVGVAILLEFASPVLIALWTRVVRHTSLPRRMWLGIALAMAGLALVAQVWEGLRLDGLGLLAGLCTAVCSAAYFLLGERGATTRDPLGLVTWGMVIGAIVVCAIVVCAIAPPWTLPRAALTAPAALGPWQPPVWLLLVAVALVSTALAYGLGTGSMRGSAPNRSSCAALHRRASSVRSSPSRCATCPRPSRRWWACSNPSSRPSPRGRCWVSR